MTQFATSLTSNLRSVFLRKGEVAFQSRSELVPHTSCCLCDVLDAGAAGGWGWAGRFLSLQTPLFPRRLESYWGRHIPSVLSLEQHLSELVKWLNLLSVDHKEPSRKRGFRACLSTNLSTQLPLLVLGNTITPAHTTCCLAQSNCWLFPE